MPELRRLARMLSVWAMRQGLLLSVCAKPTLYFSFCLSAGSSAHGGAVASRAAPAAAVVSRRRRVNGMKGLPGK
jgi:hypothetical protein